MTEKKKILIVEDEPVIALDLKKILENNGNYICNIENSFNGAIKSMDKDLPNLVILDIRLKGEKSGIDIAAEINKHGSVPYFFLTADYDLRTALLANEHQPYNYLTKPFRKHDLLIAVELALYNFKSTKNTLPVNGDCVFDDNIIFVPDQQSFRKVNTDDIIFIKGEGSYSVINSNNGKITVRAAFNKFEFLTKQNDFVKVHRSFIVNIKHIEKVYRKYLLLTAMHEVPFSGKSKGKILNHLPKL